MRKEGHTKIQSTHLASRNLERKIITASHVLCFNCISMAANFLRIIPTILSISFGAIGRVRLCSRSRLTTCVVNSLQAWIWKKYLVCGRYSHNKWNQNLYTYHSLIIINIYLCMASYTILGFSRRKVQECALALA